jgi:hypothetical protein
MPWQYEKLCEAVSGQEDKVGDWVSGCWFYLEQHVREFSEATEFTAAVEFEAAPEEYRVLICPPAPDTALEPKAVERLKKLALTVENWQTHPRLFNSKRVDNLRKLMPRAALIPQKLGTKEALAKNYPAHGTAWNNLEPAQQRRYDLMLRSCNIAVLVGRASRSVADGKTLCLCSVDLDGDEYVKPFVDKNPWTKGAQTSRGGRGKNFWCYLVLDKDKPFPDGVIHLMLAREQIGELRLGGGSLTTVSGVHESGAEYVIENGGVLPIISFDEIKLPEGWSFADDPALAEAKEAMEIAKELGKDAETVREERRAERRRVCGNEDMGGLDNCLLDLNRIECKHDKGHIIEARCPAYSDDKHNKTGDHLCIDKMTGGFGCVKHQGDRKHRARIIQLVGKPLSERERIQRERYKREEEEIAALCRRRRHGREEGNDEADQAARKEQKSGSNRADPPFQYDGKRHCFWAREKDRLRYVSVTSDRAYSILKGTGLKADAVQGILNRVVTSYVVDVGLPLAGYPVGIHNVNGRRILVPRSFTLIEPKEPKSPADYRHHLAIINGLLKDEAAYILVDLKVSYIALRDGRRSGSLAVFIVGPTDCGKTVLLDETIVPVLGGRKGNAYGFLSGRTDFNDELIACEVHAIDDGNPFDTPEARKRFGNAIKEAVASGSMWCHPKGLPGFTVPAYRRLFILANPDDIELMPEISESLMDKIMILEAHKFEMPKDCLPLPSWNDTDARERFVATLRSELPYFIHYLLNWRIPPDLTDRRFGLVAYKNQRIMDQLKEVSPLHEAASVIQKGVFGSGCYAESVEMEAKDVYERLVESEEVKDRAQKLFRNGRALGNMLGRLRRDDTYGKYFSNRDSNGKSLWTITRQPGVRRRYAAQDE